MKSARFRLYCVLICLPALALCGLGAYFLVDKVPKLVNAERGRITREYRAAAYRLAAHPETATWPDGDSGAWPERKPKGWNERSKLTLADGRRIGWGYVLTNGQSLVWIAAPRDADGYRKDGRGTPLLGVRVETVEGLDTAVVFYVAVPTSLGLFLVLTFGCLAFFVRTVRERDDFLAATAHDLTTPLVGMRRLIGRDDDEARAVVERMLRLVGNLKDFLRLGGRRPAPVPSVFALGDAFDAAYALFAADYAEEASGPVTVTGDRTLKVRADETRVVQVIWNLLGNDLKYAAPFGGVTARFAAADGCVTLELADAGPGMKPREMRRAFDRYYRAKTVLESGKGGFGIGLCTAREFARAMGGELSVRANAPHGCVFTLTLPAGEEEKV